MKKIIFISLLVVGIFGFSNITNVSATTMDQLTNNDIQKVSKDNKEYELTLNASTNENLEIKNGEKVILNLNGHTLNNTIDSGNIQVDDPTIKIEEGGTLTIQDKSSNGSGSITRTTKFPGSQIQQAIIDNYGTLNLEAGFISPQGAAIYGIYNHTDSILNMTGGRISTMHKNTFGLWNEGTANINGGRFDQNKYIVGDDYADQPAIVNSTSGNLSITDGIFMNLTGYEMSTVVPIGDSIISITGGKFEYQDPITHVSKSQDITQYLSSDYEVDKNGNVIKKENQENTPIEPEEESQTTVESNEKNPNTSDNIVNLLSIISVSAVGLLITIKKTILS